MKRSRRRKRAHNGHAVSRHEGSCHTVEFLHAASSFGGQGRTVRFGLRKATSALHHQEGEKARKFLIG